MDDKVVADQKAYVAGEGNDATLGLCTVDTILTVDQQPVVVPVDLHAAEAGQLGASQIGVEECPDNKVLLVGPTGCG